MKGYKTSKDYKRLKELLDKGYSVICLVHDKDCGLASRDIGIGWYLFDFVYSYPMEFPSSVFGRECKKNRIEFIEPNEEE